MSNNNKVEENVEIVIQDKSELESAAGDKSEESSGNERNLLTVPKVPCMPTKSRSAPTAAGCLVIDVAFDARPPSDSDFNGIKKLLQQLFVKYANDELTELSNLVVAQDFVGCVLKQDPGDDSDDDSEEEISDDEDDDNVFAVSTVINISSNHIMKVQGEMISWLTQQFVENGQAVGYADVVQCSKNLSCIKKICDLLVSKCEEYYKEDPSKMAELIGDPSKQIGLIISERFINIPPQVALPSYQSLKSDIDSAVHKKRNFSFTHLVLISKTYRAKIDGQDGDELFFSNPEERLFKEISQFNYTFSIVDQDNATDGNMDEDGGDFESLRTVMVFESSALGQMILKLQTELAPT